MACKPSSSSSLMFARSFLSKPNTKNQRLPLLVATSVRTLPRLPRPAVHGGGGVDVLGQQAEHEAGFLQRVGHVVAVVQQLHQRAPLRLVLGQLARVHHQLVGVALPGLGARGHAQGAIGFAGGGSVVKKRVGLAGRGKRGGVRTLVATNKGNRWFFVFGFEKNERANVSDEELEGLQTIAADLLARTGPQLDEAVADGALQEICQ